MYAAMKNKMLKVLAVLLLAAMTSGLTGAQESERPRERPTAQFVDTVAGPELASKLHVVLLADLGCPNHGASFRNDLETVKKFLKQAIPDANIIDLTGQEWTPTKVLDHLGQLKIGSNDNVLVYHTGHGVMLKEKQGDSHYMVLWDQPDHNDLLSRDKLRATLLGHRPRGLIMLSDCCSGFPANGRALGGPALEVTPNLATLRHLLLGVRGVVDITAAQVGVNANVFHIGPNYAGARGAFTTALLRVLSNPATTYHTWSGDFWSDLVKETRINSNGYHQPHCFQPLP